MFIEVSESREIKRFLRCLDVKFDGSGMVYREEKGIEYNK